MIKTYQELVTIPTYEERYQYLQCHSQIGLQTFGGHRHLNQVLYSSPEWRSFRRRVIIRDDGLDMAMADHPIYGSIIIHHINPITIDDVLNRNPMVFDMNNVVCVSELTHKAIHYGDLNLLPKDYVERKPGDTKLW
jgi:hypothetical protein